ncbi:MAG TPA: hypothetical protein VJS39_10290 [Gemmatimonadaceae bacterium]|nr:hypothetical protein [Gemmatimonadaceae bacterium]
MRPILFGLIAILLGCLDIYVPTDHTSTVSGTYSLKINGVAEACYTSTMADPTLVPPEVNTAFLTNGTLTLNPDGTGVFNARYQVQRHESDNSLLIGVEDSAYAVTYVRDGMDLKISWKGVPGNGQIFTGDASLWTKQPWCRGLSSPGFTERFDFFHQGAG